MEFNIAFCWATPLGVNALPHSPEFPLVLEMTPAPATPQKRPERRRTTEMPTPRTPPRVAEGRAVIGTDRRGVEADGLGVGSGFGIGGGIGGKAVVER